jgi:catechol-2,3-dioxygenase
MNKKAALDHLNLTVRNFDETASWYKTVFGFEIVEKGLHGGLPWGVLRNGDSMLCIYESPERTQTDAEETERFHRIYHFGLRINDREQWEKTLRECALPTYFGSPLRYPHSTSWYVTDPTGYMIEVALWDEDRVAF